MNRISLKHILTTGVALTLCLEAAHALPIDRAYGRQAARDSRQDGREGARDARQTGRQVSRARWAGYPVLPPGCVPYMYGGYRYYTVRGLYYYPYFYGGRTVYIQVNVQNGVPVPPPPSGSIDIYFN